MRYELALVIKPISTEDIKEKVLPKLEKTVKSFKGKLKLKDSLGKRLLATPIDSFKEAAYYFYDLELPAANADEFQVSLKRTNEILRFLVIKHKDL